MSNLLLVSAGKIVKHSSGKMFGKSGSSVYWNGTVWNTADNQQSTVATAISNASSRDVVRLNSGDIARTWSSQISIPNTKGIWLDGNGATIDRGIASAVPLIAVDTNSSVSTRVSNFNFTTSNNGGGTVFGRYIHLNGSTTNARFRVDHNTFGATSGGLVHIKVGTPYGCIDNNTFNDTANCEIIHCEFDGDNGGGNTLGWSTDVVPGSGDMVFVEQNTFNNSDDPFHGFSAVQSYYGARTVFRYNQCNMAQIDQHGTAGNVGARWWEIYGNTFTVTGNQSDCIVCRAGSGVIYDNVLDARGGSSGSFNIHLYEEDTGSYILAYQVGCGLNGASNSGGNSISSPAYCWNNSAGFSSGTGIWIPDDGIINTSRDVFVSGSQPASLKRRQISGDTSSTTYSYSPYTYPHDIRSLTGN